MDTDGDEVGSQGSDIPLESLECEEIETEDRMVTKEQITDIKEQIF